MYKDFILSLMPSDLAQRTIDNRVTVRQDRQKPFISGTGRPWQSRASYFHHSSKAETFGSFDGTIAAFKIIQLGIIKADNGAIQVDRNQIFQQAVD